MNLLKLKYLNVKKEEVGFLNHNNIKASQCKYKEVSLAKRWQTLKIDDKKQSITYI